MDEALAGFADHLIFPFVAGSMLANALQKYDIDRRTAPYLMARTGSSPRRPVLAVMLATAFLSMWVSNTATAAMMTPIAPGVLAQVVGEQGVEAATSAAASDSPNPDAAPDGGTGTTAAGTRPVVVAISRV